MLKLLLRTVPTALLLVQQVRPNTVNFFQRRRADELWKTITSVTNAGRKKGRKNTRQPVRRLKPLYIIGRSPMQVKFPGLNAPIKTQEVVDPISIVEVTNEEREQELRSFRSKVEKMGLLKRRRINEKLHPLERGFSGANICGQNIGPPPPYQDMNFDEFQSTILDLKRTCIMTGAYGRKYTMNALIFIGNGKGLGGYSVGKAPMFKTNDAIIQAQRRASRNLFSVELFEDRTIYQDFFAECFQTRVYAQRMPPGFGLHCHARLLKICQLIGIKDIFVKVEGGTTNYWALTSAFVTGLLNQETHQHLAERTRLHVVEMTNTRQYFPRIIASPFDNPVKTDEELEPLERLRIDDFYGEGRIPLRKQKRKPFYITSDRHLFAEWRKHPFRNMEKRMIRLLADGEVERWTRKERHEHGERLNKRVMEGLLPLPEGIGLPDMLERTK